ncbi:alpha/beta hydrolase-fold protein [Ectobacillus sp. JY-23]|uniref:alpha/beta hydrolase n=1 Tax=Ectobacillus sp. JY-23 TaxID=2933872 RepID=UPI001FF6CBC0|nr:alpha/beta hydrolase-fold protein [Ectobacillus sp. JY-23]UOY91897.1 alpha/beta hydrolase-fold protein [Ectobacillus sp. JY-23]
MLEIFAVQINTLENRKRTVRVYLPKDYEQTDTQYPVLYMQDGQNVFDDKEASFGVSWGLGEFLDKYNVPLIVVGIDCNHEWYNRFNEYGPWESREMGQILLDEDISLGGEGKAYVEFLVHELKPMIDARYRTLVNDTAIAGSSMGGLISTYAACVYPHIFKRVASLSSAYWFNQDELEALIQTSDLSPIQRFYLDVGTNEVTAKITPQIYVDSSKRVHQLLRSKIDCSFEIIEGAAHNEAAWRTRIMDILEYLYI